MPLYEFVCGKCDQDFELLVRSAKWEGDAACPHCGSKETRLLSRFGSTACKAQYRCLACLEPFDYFKPH